MKTRRHSVKWAALAVCLAAMNMVHAGENGDRSALPGLIDGIRATETKTQRAGFYKEQLLVMLPKIQAGEDVDLTLPETKGNTALHYAVALGDVELTRWLLAHGANPNAVADDGWSVRQCIGSKNRDEILNLLEKQELQLFIDGLQAATMKNDSSRLYQKRLLTLLPMIRDGQDANLTLPETKGNTALHYAVALGSVKITEWLLLHGADPNAKTDKGVTVPNCIPADSAPAIRSMVNQVLQTYALADEMASCMKRMKAICAKVRDKAAADAAAPEISAMEAKMSRLRRRCADGYPSMREVLGCRRQAPYGSLSSVIDCASGLHSGLRDAGFYGSKEFQEAAESLHYLYEGMDCALYTYEPSSDGPMD